LSTTLQAHHQLVWQRGWQTDGRNAEQGGKKAGLKPNNTFPQNKLNAAALAAWQRDKRNVQHMKQVLPISTMVEFVTLVQPSARQSSTMSSRNAWLGNNAGHGSRKMVTQLTRAKGVAIEQQIGSVNLASVTATVMLICWAQ
jgi:hypothetical protein